MFEIERRTYKNLEQLYEILEVGELDNDKLFNLFVVTDRTDDGKSHMGLFDLYHEVMNSLPDQGSEAMEKVSFLLVAVLSEELGIHIYEYPMEEFYPVLYELYPEYERTEEVFDQSQNAEPDYVWYPGKYDDETRNFLEICGRIQVDGGLGDDKKAEEFLKNRGLTEEILKVTLKDGWRLARLTKEKLSKEVCFYDERNIVQGTVLARHLYRKRVWKNQLRLKYIRALDEVLQDIKKMMPEHKDRFLENEKTVKTECQFDNRKFEDIVRDMEEYFAACKSVVFSSCKIKANMGEIKKYLDELKANIPEEILQYQKIIRNEKAIIGNTKKKADAIIAQARLETEDFIGDHEIMRKAINQANDILMTANDRAEEIINRANEEAKEILMRAHTCLDGILESMQEK